MNEIQRNYEDIDQESLNRAGSPQTHPSFDRLVRTVWRLRQEDGCPWDKAQTHLSIKGNMIEEAYEAAEAIQEQDIPHLLEELGDVLLQVLLHAQIAADETEFSLDDVIDELNEKLIRRHPHVFGDVSAADEDEALASWNAIKQTERASHEVPQGLLDSVPHAMPALMQCQKISKRAAKVGFDWKDSTGVWEKIHEEYQEFVDEKRGSKQATEEFGDLLFTLVNLARHEHIDAEAALQAANEKFRKRWAQMEALAEERGLSYDSWTEDEREELWEEAKRRA